MKVKRTITKTGLSLLSVSYLRLRLDYNNLKSTRMMQQEDLYHVRSSPMDKLRGAQWCSMACVSAPACPPVARDSYRRGKLGRSILGEEPAAGVPLALTSHLYQFSGYSLVSQNFPAFWVFWERIWPCSRCPSILEFLVCQVFQFSAAKKTVSNLGSRWRRNFGQDTRQSSPLTKYSTSSQVSEARSSIPPLSL